ncbi:E3 ubiquitin-protein ligase RNF12-B-like isoform X2 [Carassius auratus]|uniref:E3 ubiquitin-protein ligase RNF12-B-like isoform X2 n=1 Tax=Carassius auratus TaxID=7957 RepID=A0A6P6MNX4_CARAU|nr:E3 ubiquitin-protein ligase RNF12-B-like isoform X2 [Carassius auratus]
MFLEKMQRAYEFILTKSTSTAQQPDSDIPTAEQHNSPSEEQCNGSILEPESLAVEQPEPESLAVEQPEPESLAVEQPEPESLAVEQPEPESLAVEQPMKPTKESETLFILNLVPLSSQYSSTSLSPPSSTTFPAGLPSESSPPPPPLPCSKLLRQRKKRTKTTKAPSATSVSPPSLIPTDLSFPQSCPPPAASSISQSLRQEGPCVKKRRKGKSRTESPLVALYCVWQNLG